MSTTALTPGFRRLLLASAAACALILPAPAFAHHRDDHDSNGCNAEGNAYGHDNCDASPPPAPAPPAPEQPASESTPPPADEAPPEAAPEAPAPDAPAEDAPPSGDVPVGEPAPAPEDHPAPAPAPAPSAPEAEPAPPSSWSPEPSPPPAPGLPAAGWAPASSRPDTAAQSSPSPKARRGRTFSSAPDASWGAGERDASWGQGAQQPAASDYGLTGTGAIITVRQRHGVFGGLSFRVSMAPGSSSYVFRAARSVVAGAGGRLYRVRAWLRSDVPGLTVCMRIQEVAAADSLTSVRTSESCLSPNSSWQKFLALRRTLERGNRLVFSIYSYGAFAGDSFEVDGFIVERRVGNRWKRVDAAFGDAPLR